MHFHLKIPIFTLKCFNFLNVLSNLVFTVPGELPRLQGNSWALVPCLRWLWPSGICNIPISHILWSLRRNPFTAMLHIWQFWSRIFTNKPLSSTPSMRQCWDSCKTWALRRWFRFPFFLDLKSKRGGPEIEAHGSCSTCPYYRVRQGWRYHPVVGTFRKRLKPFSTKCDQWIFVTTWKTSSNEIYLGYRDTVGILV